MNIITGYTGEPHITSAQDRDANQGSYGTGSYILDVGAKMAASIESVNEIRIADGALCHQGCLGNIDTGMYESVAISNGSQGMKRSDLIVCRYEKDSETNVESLSLVVIEGTPDASSPSDPSYNSGDIQQGDSPVDMPLYRVNINGVNISSVTQMASNVRTQAEIDAKLSDIDSKATGTVSLSGSMTQSATYDSVCEKSGRTVTIYIGGSANTNISAGSVIATVPSGFRPPHRFRFIGYGTDGYSRLDITTAGNIQTVNALDSGKFVNAVVSFVV